MPGYFDHETAKFVYVEEMEPELVVPDLTDFKVIENMLNFIVFFMKICSVQLKPYVSYDVTDIKQGQFLARDLFNATYAKSIADEFKRGQIKPIDDDNNEENTEKTNSLSCFILVVQQTRRFSTFQNHFS